MKTRIMVPETSKSYVIDNGAKYDGRMKSFYVPEDILISNFNRYIPLSIELIPSSTWENNVRSNLKSEWNRIKTITYQKADYKCEICGRKGIEHPVEAHEIWSYDGITNIQKLEGLIALCPVCHRTKHWGLALISGQESLVTKHILKINNWKKEDLAKYLQEAFSLFDMRSNVIWKLDLSFLSDYI